MLVIDESLNSRWDLFWGQLKSHLLDDFIQGLPRHVVLLCLVVIRIVDSLLDPLLQLVLLLDSLFLNSLITLGFSGSEFVL